MVRSTSAREPLHRLYRVLVGRYDAVIHTQFAPELHLGRVQVDAEDAAPVRPEELHGDEADEPQPDHYDAAAQLRPREAHPFRAMLATVA